MESDDAFGRRSPAGGTGVLASGVREETRYVQCGGSTVGSRTLDVERLGCAARREGETGARAQGWAGV